MITKYCAYDTLNICTCNIADSYRENVGLCECNQCKEYVPCEDFDNEDERVIEFKGE